MTLILIVVTSGMPRFFRDRDACLSDQLHGVFVHGQKRPFRIIGPVIQIQKILHASYECGVFPGRNHPARFQMGLEFVFLSARCTV